MSFVLRMAWRDSRASRRRLALYSLSVVLGIAALTAIGSFGANVRRAIDLEAKGLLGADLFVTANTPLPAGVADALKAIGAETAGERTFSSMMRFPKGGRLRLVQVHALEGGFPFYGQFQTDPAGAAAKLRSDGAVVILEPTLMAQYGVGVSDEVRLGNKAFRVIGGVLKVPGESPTVALMAPRAYVPLASLAGAGLSGREALARYRVMARLPANRDPGAVIADLRQRFTGQRLSFETVEERRRDLGRTLDNLNGFLGLVGFVALVLGGIGVASALHAYVRGKVATVAILRCLGANAGQAVSVYVLQGLGLGLFGAVLGGILGVVVQAGLPRLFGGSLPIQVEFFISWVSLARALGAGLAVCLLFSLLPLVSIRRISPLAALRSTAAGAGDGRPDPLRIALIGLAAAAVTVLAVQEAGSVRVGLGFAAMLGLGFAVLGALAAASTWAARRLVPRRLPYVVRQGLANLHRPNNRTALLLLSLGLGTFLVLALFLARASLLAEIRGASAAGRPDLIFFDVQDDQIGPLREAAASAGTPVSETAPIVTMTILSLRGVPIARLSGSDEAIPGWALRREYRSTFRSELTGTEHLVQGAFTGHADPAEGPVPISVEEGLARDMRLRIGDSVVWNVQGLPVASRVASIRAVEWRRLEPNFFVVFPEGVLDDAPKTYIAALHTGSADQSARVQRAVVDRFPNVTAIDLQLIADTLDSIFSKVAFAVQFMALFTVGTGLVVLAGAILAGRRQRIGEAALLRILGATARQVSLIQFVEYAALGIQAAVVGSLLGVAGNALLAHFVFKIPAVAPVGEVAAAIAVTAALTVGTGFLAGRGVLDHPPLQIIREES